MSSAGDSTRTAGGKETASIQAVSDKAKRSKLLTRTPLMHTAATIGLLGTAAAHADVINATVEQAAKDLGATVTMEPTCRGRKHAINMMKIASLGAHGEAAPSHRQGGSHRRLL